jgi:polyribonucleotide nucleotidyltransferase
VEDVLNIGDEVKVKVLEVDEKGKISLDRIDKPEAPAGSGHGPDRQDRSDRGHDRRSNGGRRPGDGNGGSHSRQPRRHHEG